jgi:hypothetical protein
MSGVQVDSKVPSVRDKQQVEKLTTEEKSLNMMMFCIDATGQYIRPLSIFPSRWMNSDVLLV